MRNANVQLPQPTTTGERHQDMRAAVRQVERADVYLAAVVHMELDDQAAERTLRRLRADLDALRRHLSERRAGAGG